jgi:hypothetical protein
VLTRKSERARDAHRDNIAQRSQAAQTPSTFPIIKIAEKPVLQGFS